MLPSVRVRKSLHMRGTFGVIDNELLKALEPK